MGKINYQARLIVISVEADVTTRTMIDSFVVTGGSSSKPIKLKSTKDTEILTGLEQAKAKKNITVFWKPSKDDFDTVMTGLSQNKKPFGFNFDVYVSYTGTWVQFIHFFGEDAAVSNPPNRVGGGKDLLMKMDVILPNVDFNRAGKQDGRWVDDDEWNQ